MDVRALLKTADAMARDGDDHGAIRGYAEAAREYAKQGFALKALAVWKQLREIAKRDPAHHAADAEARAAMIALYRALGLESDAVALETDRSRVH